MKKRYIITLYDPDDWDIFHDEMISTCAHPFVPYRQVVCSDYIPISDKQAIYMLTEDEANKISQDPRVEIIELHPDDRDDIEVVTAATQTSTFDQTGNLDFSYKNWGLLRSTSQTNPFAATTSVTGNFNYTLTGKGVDIIVADTGVAEGHPELAVNPDGTGGSRVVDFDWSSVYPYASPQSGGSGINGYLGDCGGHGSNCATIAAGNTNGWAKDAYIYTYRCIPPSGANADIVTGKYLELGSPFSAFYIAKAFHLAKPIDPATGYKRPTIITCSWLFEQSYPSSFTSTTWRGTTYANTTRNAAYGQIYARYGVRQSSIDVAAAEAMAAGVIVVACAGNNYHKADVENGIDYNNSYNLSTSSYYYHRGTSPGAGASYVNGQQWKVICVGSHEPARDPSKEWKSGFSVVGPRVDIYAPGRNIMGAGSTAYRYIDDPRNPIYKLSKLTGTSMATPQVAGMLACVAQARPWMNQNDARNWLFANAVNGALDEDLSYGTGYDNVNYLQGGPNRIMYTPFNSSLAVNASGDVKFQRLQISSQ